MEEGSDESDEITPTPEERAQIVWEFLREYSQFSTWDLVCFCVEYLGLISAEYPWLKESAKKQNVLVYKYHMMHKEEIAKWEATQISERVEKQTKTETSGTQQLGGRVLLSTDVAGALRKKRT